MKVFASLLVVAFVAVAASAAPTETAEAKLKDSISRVNRAILEIKKEIEAIGVNVQYSTNSHEKDILNSLVATLNKQIKMVTEAKGKLEAKLPKNLSTISLKSVEARIADGIAQIKKASAELQKTVAATAAKVKASGNSKEKKVLQIAEEIYKKEAVKLKDAMEKIQAKVKKA